MAFLTGGCGKAELEVGDQRGSGGGSDADLARGGSSGGAEQAQSGGSTAQSGGTTAQSGGTTATAGAPNAAGSAGECFQVGAAPTIDFASPEVIRDRLAAFLLEGTSTAPLPDQTTAEWAAELATSFVQGSPDANPAFTRLLAGWFSGPALRASVTPEREAALSAQGMTWGAGWSRTLSSHWDIGALLTHSPSDPAGSVGILTDPEVLSLYDTILWRGFWLTSSFICANVPPEPLSPPSMRPMTREQVTELGAMSTCGGCHRYFDAAGFAFQQFDTVGNFSAAPVDTSGRFVTPGGGAFEFSDIADLGAQLGSSCEVAHCIASQFLSQAWDRTGVSPVMPEDEIQFVANRFAASGFSAIELVRAVAASPSMLSR